METQSSIELLHQRGEIPIHSEVQNHNYSSAKTTTMSSNSPSSSNGGKKVDFAPLPAQKSGNAETKKISREKLTSTDIEAQSNLGSCTHHSSASQMTARIDSHGSRSNDNSRARTASVTSSAIDSGEASDAVSVLGSIPRKLRPSSSSHQPSPALAWDYPSETASRATGRATRRLADNRADASPSAAEIPPTRSISTQSSSRNNVRESTSDFIPNNLDGLTECLNNLTTAIAANQTTISSLSTEISLLRSDIANANDAHVPIDEAAQDDEGAPISDRGLNFNIPAEPPRGRTQFRAPGRPRRNNEPMDRNCDRNVNGRDGGMRENYPRRLFDDYGSPYSPDRMARSPVFVAGGDGYENGFNRPVIVVERGSARGGFSFNAGPQGPYFQEGNGQRNFGGLPGSGYFGF